MEAQTIINPEKEYEALKQESLKISEFNFQLININLTLAGAFLGFGIQDNMIAMLLPPIELVILTLWRKNQWDILKINYFIAKKFEGVEMPLSWETHSMNNNILENKLYNSIFKFGQLGLFLLSSIIALIVGYLGYVNTTPQNLLIFVDYISVITITIVFFMTTKERLISIISVEEL